MDIDTIKNYLQKYKKMSPPDGTIQEAVCEVVEAVCDVSLDKDDVHLTKEGAHLDTTPLVRSAILIKKETIMEKLQEKLGDDAPAELR